MPCITPAVQRVNHSSVVTRRREKEKVRGHKITKRAVTGQPSSCRMPSRHLLLNAVWAGLLRYSLSLLSYVAV